MKHSSESYNPGQVRLRYNRTERLAKAPESVQRMHRPDYIQKPGLIKSLTATRASRYILFSIILVCILMLLSVFLQLDRTSGKLNGIPVKLESLIQEETIYINIVFAATKQEDGYMLPVTVHLTARNIGTGAQETKTIEAVYIGSSLRIPAQFLSEQCTEAEAVIAAEKSSLRLHRTY
ncbi:MAG: hypothetical protein P1P65_07325 [Treponema sp.]